VVSESSQFGKHRHRAPSIIRARRQRCDSAAKR